MTMRVVAAGHATVQDLGRPGLGWMGVPVGGAADPWALRAGNRLCGNDDDAAAIELALGAISLRCADGATIAVVGASCAVEIGEQGVAAGRAMMVPPHGTITVRLTGNHMAFAYLCVAGGIGARRILGSASALVRAGIGSALRPGDEFPIGAAGPVPEPPRGHPIWGSSTGARVIPGPDAARFGRRSRRALVRKPFTITPRGDRVGRRLSGPALRAEEHEIEPAGMVPGAIQVPPDGNPIVLGPDGPVTGGYPVIATIISADLSFFMQAPPGASVRFTRTTIEEARNAWLERERALDEYVARA